MIMPYLNFTGDCEAVFRLYQRVFNGQASVFARYSDAPESDYPELDAARRNWIMHGYIMLTKTGGVRGADALWPLEKGSAVHIHVYCANIEKARKAFAILAEEGESISMLAPNPAPHDNSASGMVKDKYGFAWVLSTHVE